MMNYKILYNQIITNANNRTLNEDIYTEKHHIVPKCMGGDNSKENLVVLTAREHYICHKLLWKMYPNNNKLFFAYNMMSIVKNKNQKRDFKISSKEYEILKKENAKRNSELHKGKPKSEEHKRKTSETLKGRYCGKDNPMYGRTGKDNPRYGIKGELHQNYNKKATVETKNKISKGNTGKIRSDESKLRYSQSKIGNKNPNFGKVFTEEEKRIRREKQGIKILVLGVRYESIKFASQQLNISRSTLSTRLNSKETKYNDYKIIKE